ncbi:sap145 [Candida theae]|uniref:Sap145 n=1 Tax=Candida theae TaxID=1198502 RepID=A0AAD5BET6_9ASCO|nr:sap145 [Candida theae]KAI5957845.1 sap145 [Candida theae]
MSVKRSKNQIRRERLKKRKLEEKNVENSDKKDTSPELTRGPTSSGSNATEHQPTTSIPDIKIDENDPLLQQFGSVLAKFNPPSPKEGGFQVVESSNKHSYTDEEDDDDASDESDKDDETQKSISLSKRQLRLRNKVPLSSLKMSTHRPEIVEPTDADALDPYLLVHIKSQPNIVPVPSHWSSKRDYLSSKRGIERPPFQLPKFIRDTGIEEMRSTVPGTGGDDGRTLKQQQRDRVQVKLGRLDMDYEKLYRAFFQNQTKPRLSAFGELYEEGKELVDELTNEAKHYKPGVVSKTLRKALGMNEHDLSIAPAWVIIMKDIGKPPSYRDLIIPGVDEEYNNGGYRDRHADGEARIEHWGRIKSVVEDDSEEEDEEEEEEEEEEDRDENAVENEKDGNEKRELQEADSIETAPVVIDNDSSSDDDDDDDDDDSTKKSSLKDVLFKMFENEKPPESDS